MIKAVLMDCDGPIIKRKKYFSRRLLDLGIKLDMQKINGFFHNEFLLCETGKADLKTELSQRIAEWGWNDSLEKMLDFWFSGETATDQDMLNSIICLRKQGIKCFMATDQEKYRTEYLLETVGLKQYFDAVYSSCTVGCLKREVEFWEKLHQDLAEYAKEDVLVWDDDPLCLTAANKYGFRTGLYKNFENYKQVMFEEFGLKW